MTKLPANVKGKVYSSVVRPAMVYGLEAIAAKKKEVEEIEVEKIKMLKIALGVTRKDKIRNEYIRGTVKVEPLEMKMREGRSYEVVWTCHMERSGVCRKKGDGNGVTGKKKKREAKEKISGCGEGGYEGCWCEGEGH